MASIKGICGFETGRTDTGYALTGIGAIVSGGRSGLYSFEDKTLVAATQGYCSIDLGATAASGQLFQLKVRICFQVNQFPSANDYIVCEIHPSLGFQIQMNTAGKLRMVTTLNGAPAYSAQTVIGHWYLVELRYFGYNKLSGLTNSGRYRATCQIWDIGTAGIDELDSPLATFVSDSQSGVNVVNISCNGVTGKFAVPGDALQEMKSKVVDYRLTVTLSAPGGCGVNANGEYSIFPSQISAEGPDGGVPCTSPCTATNGTVIENGLLNGLDIQLFQKGNSSLPASIVIDVGNNGAVNCTRSLRYDDIFWELQLGTDVPFQFGDIFPVSTHVQPFPVIDQGFYDLFTPADGFASVNAIPMVDTGTITASLINKATSYLHSALGLENIVEHLRVYTRIQGAVLAQSLIAFVDPSDLTFAGITIPGATDTRIGDFPLEYQNFIDAVTFNILEYGVILDHAGAVNLHSIFMEVLTGEPDLVLTGGGANGGAPIVGGLNLGDLGITQGDQILITDGSGIYSMTPGQFFDTLYARNASQATVDVQIPLPFWKSTYFGG